MDMYKLKQLSDLLGQASKVCGAMCGDGMSEESAEGDMRPDSSEEEQSEGTNPSMPRVEPFTKKLSEIKPEEESTVGGEVGNEIWQSPPSSDAANAQDGGKDLLKAALKKKLKKEMMA